MALTDNIKNFISEGAYRKLYAEKQANTGSDYYVYNGSLMTYGTTGGIKKANSANGTELFAGMVVDSNAPILVKKSAGASPEKSTDEAEDITLRIQGVIKVKTAVGITNTIKCSNATNGQDVYIVDDEYVCCKGTATGNLIRVGKQIEYVSDNEVYVLI